MGFDLTRFVGEVDEEFHCSICSMVFQSPVETPCGHVFCNECVVAWISAYATCPIELTPLSQSVLKSPNKLFSNLLAKLKINCDFVKEGCNALIELGHLQHHLTICKFNPDSEVTCSKGCNGKIHGREYEEHNCLTHLSNLMSELLNENKISQFAAAFRQNEQMAKLEKVIEEQNNKIQRLKEGMQNLDDEISKLCVTDSPD